MSYRSPSAASRGTEIPFQLDILPIPRNASIEPTQSACSLEPLINVIGINEIWKFIIRLRVSQCMSARLTVRTHTRYTGHGPALFGLLTLFLSAIPHRIVVAPPPHDLWTQSKPTFSAPLAQLGSGPGWRDEERWQPTLSGMNGPLSTQIYALWQ